MALASVSEFFSNLYTTTIIFLSMLLLEAVVLSRSIYRNSWLISEKQQPLTATRFLALIEEKHPTIRYRNELWPDLIECAVCLSKLEEGEDMRELHCKHSFHKDCLDRWLQHEWAATCPLCRSSVLEKEIVNERRRLRSVQQDYDHDHDHDHDEELVFLLSALHGINLHRLL